MQFCFLIDFNNGKITYAIYLKQDRDRKRIQREAMKKTTKYEDYKAKDRMRKRKQKSQ